MSVSLRTRIALYVLALGLAAGAFIVVGAVASAKRSLWIARLQRWEIESADSAAECKAAVRDLHFKLLRYELSRGPNDKAEFLQAEEALAQWIEKRSGEIVVPETRRILREIRTAFAGYQMRADELLNHGPAAGNDSSARQMLDRIEQDANLIVAIDTKLRAAQRDSLRAFVTRARRDVDWIWRLFYGCMAALFVCGAVLARVIYRDLIAPLRSSVAHSRVLLQRQEKLSALGLLVAGIAHEIRNPLNSIKARLFTQRRFLGANSPGLEDNEFIEGEIDRLEAVVEDSLKFARPAPPSLQRQPLRPTLGSLCELARPALVKANIELRTDFSEDPELSFDANQLKQALLNLLNNAAESVGDAGVITLQTRRATLLRGRQRLAAVAIEVQDNGPGVSRDVQSRLFDPFFTTKENGTGLGLSLTAQIVHAHHGWIECESSPGRGALFRILLPTET
jgi:signal transduction histidine kinase